MRIHSFKTFEEIDTWIESLPYDKLADQLVRYEELVEELESKGLDRPDYRPVEFGQLSSRYQKAREMVERLAAAETLHPDKPPSDNGPHPDHIESREDCDEGDCDEDGYVHEELIASDYAPERYPERRAA